MAITKDQLISDLAEAVSLPKATVRTLIDQLGEIVGDALENDGEITLPGVGREGQLNLKKAKVLIIGTGGLGSPISLYLAAAGIGTLGLVDFDVVESSNLQRQNN